MTIPQYNTNLRRRSALLRKLADIIDNLFGCGFEPGGYGAGVGDRGGGDAFAFAVETTHSSDEKSEVVEVVGWRVALLDVEIDLGCGIILELRNLGVLVWSRA
jgi:hypothetical protein